MSIGLDQVGWIDILISIWIVHHPLGYALGWYTYELTLISMFTFCWIGLVIILNRHQIENWSVSKAERDEDG